MLLEYNINNPQDNEYVEKVIEQFNMEEVVPMR